MKIIKNFHVGFCFVQTGVRRRYCLVIRLSKKCYLGVKFKIAITTIMLMCILICNVYKIILKSLSRSIFHKF